MRLARSFGAARTFAASSRRASLDFRESGGDMLQSWGATLARRVLLATAAVLASAAVALAQGNPTGTISGHIVDDQGLAIPGATVSASSPSLQGVRTTTTSANGDYIIPFLPAGDYQVTFE